MTSEIPQSLPLLFRGVFAVNPTRSVEAITMLTQSVQFMSMRMDLSLRAQKDLLSCKTPAEVYDVQSEYLTTTLEHYNLAAKGMMDLWRDMMRDAALGAARADDDMPVWRSLKVNAPIASVHVPDRTVH